MGLYQMEIGLDRMRIPGVRTVRFDGSPKVLMAIWGVLMVQVLMIPVQQCTTVFHHVCHDLEDHGSLRWNPTKHMPHARENLAVTV